MGVDIGRLLALRYAKRVKRDLYEWKETYRRDLYM